MADDLTTIKQRIDKAHTEICEIAEQGVSRRWRMHIPADPDQDSDLLISRALKDAEELAAEVERLRKERDSLKAATDRSKVAGAIVGDVLGLVKDYSDESRDLIARMPFLATLNQICLEKYGVDIDQPIGEAS